LQIVQDPDKLSTEDKQDVIFGMSLEE